MNTKLKERLIGIAKEKQTKDDPSHDFQHTLRVLNLAIQIAEHELADLDIVIPAALFHDIVVYKKDSVNSKNETEESAKVATNILKKINDYPPFKIRRVSDCIKECSFSKGTKPSSLESKILQDADKLESTGAISIMRVSSSGGQMNRQFYNPNDPFCEQTTSPLRSNIDVFFGRLLIVEKKMHTKIAKRIAKRRTAFLRKFIKEFKLELKESKIKTGSTCLKREQ